MKKTFVLDTNVLLHNAACIESFADNTVVLPMAVIEELDKFKGNNDELGRAARQVIRSLDRLRRKGRLGEGVPLANGGRLKIILDGPRPDTTGLASGITDNKILRVAHSLRQAGERVIFVSKDINARIKSDALGLETMDFEKQKVNFEDLFTGYRRLAISAAQAADFERTGRLADPPPDLAPNEFVLLTDSASGRAVVARARPDRLPGPLSEHADGAWNITPRSPEQRMALELLSDESVPLVTLVGQAGTGKTLLALAVGLDRVAKAKRYDKMLVSRPIMPLGKDIGFLPGDKESKLLSWMQPIFDNLAYLMRDGGGPKQSVREKIERLQREHLVELEALTYIRGRSIPRQFVIIDEAQNLTPHEVKTIISRAGDGTKIVLTGDPSQIDNPYLDSNSNGLSYTVERLKTSPLHGHITLVQSERSALAALAAEKL